MDMQKTLQTVSKSYQPPDVEEYRWSGTLSIGDVVVPSVRGSRDLAFTRRQLL